MTDLQINRTQALSKILELMQINNLSVADITHALATENKPHSTGSLLQTVITYIGAAFVFMGICIYIGMIWDDLNSISRIIVTLGSGFVAFVLGLFTLGDEKYEKATTPLFLIGAALQPTGLFVFMDEYLPSTGDLALPALVVFGFMLSQQAIAFWATQRTSILFFTLAFFYATLYSALSLIETDPPEGLLAMGLSMLMVCWGIQKTNHHSITPFYFLIGALMTTTASFDLLKDSPFDTGMIAVSAGLIYLSTLAASRTLLTVSALSLLAFLGYFTDEYFADTIGWPIAMIVFGIMMIGISVFAVKLGRKIGRA